MYHIASIEIYLNGNFECVLYKIEKNALTAHEFTPCELKQK